MNTSDDWQRPIYIQNIPYDISEDELSNWCATFGPVRRCRLMYDKFRQSRGFAFVHFVSPEGYYHILNRGPHYCKDRRLVVRPSKGSDHPNDPIPSAEPEPALSMPIESHPDEENFQTAADDPGIYDDQHDDELIVLRDELEANLECLRIQHEHEIDVLLEQIKKEKTRRDEVKELYRAAKEDCETVRKNLEKQKENVIKNTIQTFNLRREFARQIKAQTQILNDLQSRSQSSMSS